jgi:2-oxoacid dehydrogenases acyltransferase (catalytic domain)
VRAGCATVNDLSFPGAPPMRSYKPTQFPDQSDSLRLTLGPTENKVVARGDHFASISIMPLFVRADHRLADAQQVGRFVAVVRNLLNHPERLALSTDPPVPDRNAHASSVAAAHSRAATGE